MKKKFYRILAGFLTIILFANVAGVVSFSDIENDEITDDDVVIEKIDTETTSTHTATQDEAKDDYVDVDDDISEDIAKIIGDEWEIIHISTSDDLINLARNCRLDTWSRNKYVYLDADISMIGVTFAGIPTFGGIFDGNNHKITDIDINESEPYLGLFNRIQLTGIVKDLGVTGRIIPEGKQTIIGSIAGSNAGIISNCHFTGVVNGEDYIGGIAGINELTGIIVDCKTEGYVSGVHFTGGIVGENMGNIVRCNNKSAVNITNPEKSMSLSDVDAEALMAIIFPNGEEKDNAEATAMINGVSDIGGIAGISIGVLQFCTNDADIGYEAVGYNIGGIAGRQSGYIYSCINKGTILGRKDVGGIVGQAEPYVTIDFASDVTQQLSENIEKLHDIISVTLRDAGTESDIISTRLTIIQAFTDNALTDTRFLANETIDWTNGMVASSNEAISRIDYILEESAKRDGVIDKTSSAAANSKNAASKFAKTIDDLDIYQYMDSDQQIKYKEATDLLKSATTEYAEYMDEMYKAYYNYYMDEYKRGSDYTHSGEANEDLLCYKYDDNGETQYKFKKSDGFTLLTDDDVIKTQYDIAGTWVHKDTSDADSEEKSFPDTSSDEQKELDEKLIKEVTKKADDMSKLYANSKYSANHSGRSYDSDMAEASRTVSDIMMEISGKMSDQARADAEEAMQYIEGAADDLRNAGEKTKDILSDINERSDITMPSLSAQYKEHANSLTDNLQGMCDNFGLLNTEMHGASDNLISDLQAVNDQFNVIMLLFTDAIDGVLDNDYSDTYEDNSLEVAEYTTDATIDECINYGSVEGSINVSGIAGTMAIEYEYDLESDVTGIKDAAMNRTYLTKCVLRNNVNLAKISAQKSYAGGVCALQEMGTIIGCENYSLIESKTASYVGGIVGKSLSNIVRCYAKCSMSGLTYVGGIAGDATNIYDCVAMVKTKDANTWYGAIAGHVADDGIVRENFFIGNELAGIDRISYSMKAEPISYEEAILREDVPRNFAKLNVEFILKDDITFDDESVSTLDILTYSYGDEVSFKDYPTVPQIEGYYVVWDIEGIDNLIYDEVVTASYERNNTTLAGNTLRENNQSAILVDGSFTLKDSVTDTICIGESDQMENCVEYWSVIIPDDGNDSHTIRYAKSEEMRDFPQIFVLSDGQWVEIPKESIGMMGSYSTFVVSGNDVKLQMIYSGRKYDIILKVLIAAGAIVLIAIVWVVIIIINRNKSKVKNKVKSMVEKNIESIQSRDSAIKFATPEDIVQEDGLETENEK